MSALEFNNDEPMSFADWLLKTAEGFQFRKQALAEARAVQESTHDHLLPAKDRKRLKQLGEVRVTRGATAAEAKTAREKMRTIRAKR